MLTTRDIETIRAALLFWQQEMTPHDESAWGSYLEAVIQPLTVGEINELRERLASRVRFALFDVGAGSMGGTQLWGSPDDVPLTSDHLAVATILLPASPK